LSTAGPSWPAQPFEGPTMRSILLFLLGIPIPIIILIALFT
jgi:hypothetical protein